ncbi:MAG: flippase-like domain-containing protein [Chloroflexi bacterium]|nr:flippase-like domain-containing protein [Chloroflexota bacterium]
MFKRKTSWLGIGLALVFLVLFLYRVDFRQLLQVLGQANYVYIVPAIMVYFFGVWLRAVRWRLLLQSLGNFPPHRLMPPIVVGFAINNILPARVGLIARAYLVGAWEGISKIGSGATVAVDQLFDGLALLFFLEVIAIAVPLPPWARALALVAAIVFIGFFVLLLIVALSPRLTVQLAGKLTRRLPERWQPRVADGINMALNGLAPLQRPDKLAIAFSLSLLVWATEAAMYYIVSLSFGLHQPYYVMLLLMSIANIAITPPSLPGGIGPFEFFGKQTILLFGVSEGVATAYVAVLHATVLLPVTLVGLALLAARRTSLAQAIGWSGDQR